MDSFVFVSIRKKFRVWVNLKNNNVVYCSVVSMDDILG